MDEYIADVLIDNHRQTIKTMMAMRQMRADITEEALREAFHDNEHNKTIH